MSWCAGMVVVPKKSGAVRICVDLKPLNESVLRAVHPIPTVDETLSHLSGATVFSKLDANSGFWQIPLAEESKPLTTFITPMGRYYFNKLPFGISSAPELFQKRMKTILEGLEGTVCHMDDILVFGADQAEHNGQLERVLTRLQEKKVTLNPAKCMFNQCSVKFLGHIVDGTGIRADPDKVSAVKNMDAPQCVADVRRFMGMINQLGKFSPRISEISQPLRELLSSKRTWVWGPDQEQAFCKLKDESVKPTVLALYNPQAEGKISADASSFGIGAVFLQKSGQIWKPVAYASCAMLEAEKWYAQIEKEALAVTWACEKFACYVQGTTFQIESDHKPLIPLLSTKQLDNLPPRILRFRLRLAKFSYTIHHVPGKLLYTADTLSRAPLPISNDDTTESDEVEQFVASLTTSLPASNGRLQVYATAQDSDPRPVCTQVKGYCRKGWPERKQAVVPDIRPYWKVRESLTIAGNLLMFNHRIVVPPSLRNETLRKIHTGHQGIERCQMRVRESVWWPGVIYQTAQMVQQCQQCTKEAHYRKEPMIKPDLPDYPWQIIGTDLFELKGH